MINGVQTRTPPLGCYMPMGNKTGSGIEAPGAFEDGLRCFRFVYLCVSVCTCGCMCVPWASVFICRCRHHANVC